MRNDIMIQFKKLLKSVHHAIAGFKFAFLHEQNFKIMVFGVALAFLVLLLKPLPFSWKAALVLASALLLAVELINTAIERAMDVLLPASLAEIRKIKDVMAGAALIVSVAWAIVFLCVLVA